MPYRGLNRSPGRGYRLRSDRDGELARPPVLQNHGAEGDRSPDDNGEDRWEDLLQSQEREANSRGGAGAKQLHKVPRPGPAGRDSGKEDLRRRGEQYEAHPTGDSRNAEVGRRSDAGDGGGNGKGKPPARNDPPGEGSASEIWTVGQSRSLRSLCNHGLRATFSPAPAGRSDFVGASDETRQSWLSKMGPTDGELLER